MIEKYIQISTIKIIIVSWCKVFLLVILYLSDYVLHTFSYYSLYYYSYCVIS